MLTDTFTLTVIASTAFVTSLPWLIAYHSQTEYLKEENRHLADEVGQWSVAHDDLLEDLDAVRTKLAAEKAENENLTGFNEALRKRLANAVERGPKGTYLPKSHLRAVA